MIGLKEFAIPFGLIAISLWVWLYRSSPRVLIWAFLATVMAMVLMYRSDEVVQLTFEPRRVLVQMKEVRSEIFAKVDEVRKLAEGVGELTAYNVAQLWRWPPENPDAARLEERDRIGKVLRDAGVAEDRVKQILSKITDMVARDLASDVWLAVPKAVFTTETVPIRKELADLLLQSPVGAAEAAARDFLQPRQAWTAEAIAAVKRFDEFRRTGQLPPKSAKPQGGSR